MVRTKTSSLSEFRSQRSPSIDLPSTGSPSAAIADVDVVVHLHGEHDCSTVPALSEILAAAVALDQANLVVDLRDVTFMDSGTVTVLINMHDLLSSQSRTFVLRAPSPSARRVLGLCGADDLIEAQTTGPPVAAHEPAARRA